MSNVVVNPYRFKEPSPYIDGLGSGGDGLVTWYDTLNPETVTGSGSGFGIPSNLPPKSWKCENNYRPKITTNFTANMGTKFSFSCWFKHLTIGEWDPILGGKGLYDGNEEFISYWLGYGLKYVGGDSLGDKSLNSTISPPLGYWTYICYTIDGDAGEYNVWVGSGGSLVEYSSSSGVTGAGYGTYPLTVFASRASGANNNYANGYFSQFLHYDRVLTDAEIALLWGSHDGIALPAITTTLQDGLKIYYDFQETNTGASGTFTIHNVAVP